MLLLVIYTKKGLVQINYKFLVKAFTILFIHTTQYV
jgi:hypothetical protein